MKLQSSIAAVLIFIFPILPFFSSAVADLNSERQALLDFSATVAHSQKLNWNAATPVCTSWVGIICNLDKSNVIGIHLPGIGLIGSIPANSIGKLDALRVLSLHSNFLYGSLPSDILSIPSLEYLYLQHNNFSGALPASLSPNLIVLDFSFNSFSGYIPTRIQNLTRLTALSLQNNSMSGAIPNLNFTGLKLLNLSYNNLNGLIPHSLQKYPNSSFIGNSLLCGVPLNPCSKTSSQPSHPPTHFPSSPKIPKSQKAASPIKKLGPGSVIAVAIGASAVLFLSVLMILIYCLKRTSKEGMLKGKASGDGKSEKPVDFGSGVQEAEKNKLFFFEGCYYNFDLEDLLRASAEVLGKGSYGTTYKAVLDEETTVVVKRLKEVMVGKREFELHMEVVERVGKHPNIVPPRAYYYSKDEKLLVYNYMPAGSLFVHLHGSRDAGRPPLDWDSRVKISLGIGRGIAHIHTEGGSTKCFHGNLKSTNVLLTQDLEACISDVGLSPLMNFPLTMSRATGYRAPEATDIRKITQKSDVYSFGVLLLEMLTGKPALQYPGHDSVVDLPRWVTSVVREEWTAEVFDVELLREQHIEEEMVQMLQIALACVSKLPEARPKMDEVVRMIEELRQSDSKTKPSSASEFDVQTP